MNLQELQARARMVGLDPTPYGDDPEALSAAIEAHMRKTVKQATAISVREVVVGDDGRLQGWPPV